MRIALVAPLVERVPPVRYGGTERVVANLAEGLVDRGHQVTLFGTGDSITRAELVPSVPRAIWHDLDYDVDPAWPLTAQLARVARRQDDFDIIHNHSDYSFLPLLFGLETMAVTTLHGRLDHPHYRDLLELYSFAPMVSISDAQRKGTGGIPLNWVATVHHGLSPGVYRYRVERGSYLVFLGRIAPEKGPEAAIRLALETGIPIKIAAKIPAENREYFGTRIQPLLRQPGVEFVGEVDEAEKVALLGGALALVAPADWPEPFGLAMIEAMACGTPVVALSRGSVPEIVLDGVTGFTCDRIGEMADACGRAGEISRAACRERFEQFFSVDRMVDSYLQVYADLLSGAPSTAAQFRRQRKVPVRRS
ncbi:MAG: glycosyltransferase family 4 protein [Candidatus Dormibacteria bacterium]